MLAAQLNELGISPQQSQPQPEAPPRNNRSQTSASAAVKQTTPSNNNNNQPVNPLDPIDSSDSDSEPDEPNDRTRNDGTLLASDPPKPLWVEVLFFGFNFIFHGQLFMTCFKLSYRPGGGIGILSSDSTATSSSNQGGPPNRPLPPTPDDDAQGDRTLIMKRVSESCALAKSLRHHHIIFFV